MRLSIQQEPTHPSACRDVRLVVFSDDWGRHPSSCQHLVRELLLHNRACCRGGCPGCQAYEVHWVNTIGTRRPSLTLGDLSRGVGKLRGWLGKSSPAASSMGGLSIPGLGLANDLQVSNPRMWPGFRRPWQRRLNAGLLSSHVDGQLGRRRDAYRVAITTLPITADLVGKVDVDRWVYYCVDDFSVWPGLDSRVMQAMERELVNKVDVIVTASQTLQARIKAMGREASLLTHGIDEAHWQSREAGAKPQAWPETGPVVLFWGLIDQRLDMEWCRQLGEAMSACGGTLILAGPQQTPDPAINQLKNTLLPGPVPYGELPWWAACADVLVMPYADLPVTRAMQPLKLKEYLATGKPVVLRDLPATRDWSDAADVVGSASAFVDRVHQRIDSGLPALQKHARQRLSQESWAYKATQLAQAFIKDVGQDAERIAA